MIRHRFNSSPLLPNVAKPGGIAVAAVRFAAAAVPATFVITTSSSPASRAAAWIVTAYAATRMMLRSTARPALILDAVVASIALGLTGDQSSPLLSFGVAAAAAAGIAGGAGFGVISGTIVISASVPLIARHAGLGMAELNRAATWSALFPLSGIVAGLARSVWHSPGESGDEKTQGERSRIARDLHDGVAQTLAHLRLELDMLAHPQLAGASDPEEMARLARVAERTLADVRAIIRDLAEPQRHPDQAAAAAPAGQRLHAALDAYIQDLSTPHGPRITLRAGDVHVESSRDSAHLFRIAQEALSNAVRHSNASHVDVAIQQTERSVRLRIDDDGIGLPPAGVRIDGLGLSAMRERAAALGGLCSIEPRPGGGTRVTIDIPTALERIA